MKVSFSATKKNDATIENNVRLQYAASKRIFPKVRWVLILLVVGSPLIILVGKIVHDWVFITSPGAIWMEKRTINSNEGGTVAKVFYRNGDPVGSGATIFRVKREIPENRKEQLALLEAEHETLIKEMANKDPEPADTKETSEQIKLANQSIVYYEQVRDQTKWLMDKRAATKAELDVAENNLRQAKAALTAIDVAQETNNTAVSKVNLQRIAQVEQSIKGLKNMAAEFFDIKTSQEGKVGSILVNEGQSFAAGEPLATIVNTKLVHIITYVKPKDLKKINIGTVATVKIPGTGRKIKVTVEQPPVVADNVPNGISDKIYPYSTRGVQVFLKVPPPLLEQEKIDGLPLVVEW